MQFERIGIPVRDAGLFSYTVGPSASGCLDTVYLSFFQSQAPWFVVGVNTSTGECRHYQGEREEGCWAVAPGPDGCIYTGTCTREGRINRINPKTGSVEDLGTAVRGETYIWNMVTGADGFMYGGTFPNAKLFRFDPATGLLEDLGSVAPGEKYNRRLIACGDYIYCAVGTVRPHVVAYNVRLGTMHTILLPRLDISGTPAMIQSESGVLYCSLSADRYGSQRAYMYKIVGLEAEPVEAMPPAKLQRLGDGRCVVGADDRRITLLSPTGEQTTLPYSYHGAGAMVFVLRNGPNGKLYGSTALPLRLFSIDPHTNAMANLGNPTATGGEIYSILSYEERMYTCAYPRAALTVYNPQLTEPSTKLGFIGEGQDRAPSMIIGPDDHIYIGTIPTYGELGGALTRLDPKKNTWVVNRHIIPDQSVVSLAPDPAHHRIYAGSSITGGGGSRPKATCAYLFAWDCESQTKLGQWQPFASASEITTLAVWGRQLYGFTADGRFFVFDLNAETVVHQAEPGLGRAYSEALTPYGHHLVGLLGNHVVSVDPATYKIDVLGECPGISVGFAINDDHVYIASKAEIVRGELAKGL